MPPRLFSKQGLKKIKKQRKDSEAAPEISEQQQEQTPEPKQTDALTILVKQEHSNYIKRVTDNQGYLDPSKIDREPRVEYKNKSFLKWTVLPVVLSVAITAGSIYQSNIKDFVTSNYSSIVQKYTGWKQDRKESKIAEARKLLAEEGELPQEQPKPEPTHPEPKPESIDTVATPDSVYNKPDTVETKTEPDPRNPDPVKSKQLIRKFFDNTKDKSVIRDNLDILDYGTMQGAYVWLVKNENFGLARKLHEAYGTKINFIQSDSKDQYFDLIIKYTDGQKIDQTVTESFYRNIMVNHAHTASFLRGIGFDSKGASDMERACKRHKGYRLNLKHK